MVSHSILNDALLNFPRNNTERMHEIVEIVSKYVGDAAKKIYLLRRDPNGYDEAIGFIICASSEDKARILAAEQAGDEGSNTWLFDVECQKIGISSSLTSKDEVILRSFKAG